MSSFCIPFPLQLLLSVDSFLFHFHFSWSFLWTVCYSISTSVNAFCEQFVIQFPLQLLLSMDSLLFLFHFSWYFLWTVFVLFDFHYSWFFLWINWYSICGNGIQKLLLKIYNWSENGITSCPEKVWTKVEMEYQFIHRKNQLKWKLNKTKTVHRKYQLKWKRNNKLHFFFSWFFLWINWYSISTLVDTFSGQFVIPFSLQL
jgi:hypothetical protein